MASIPGGETLSFVALAPDERVLAFTLNEVHESPASTSVDTEPSTELSVESTSAPTNDVVSVCACNGVAMDKVVEAARGASSISTRGTAGLIASEATTTVDTLGELTQNDESVCDSRRQTGLGDSSERARDVTIESHSQSDTSSPDQNALSHSPLTLLPVFAYLQNVDQLYFNQVCNSFLIPAAFFSLC